MIPISTDTPIRRTPYVNYVLVGLNVVIFLLTGGAEGADGAGGWRNRLVELGTLEGGDPLLYQFFTYQFLHANWAHIGGNMLFLWTFGNPVNAKMGHGPYLFFYLAGGVFAATGYGFYHDTNMIGASGAIAAVTTAYLALFPRSHITILYWFFFIGTFELPSMIMIVFKMILWDNILAPQMTGGISNVAFGAHLAGYGFGFAASAGMLALRFLPRDQFDIVALGRRWYQRRYMESVMADPSAQAQARFGRVARPVMMDAKGIRPLPDPTADLVTDIRMQVAEALSREDRDAAAALYEKLLETDPRQVLGRSQQLEVAQQFAARGLWPQAVAAFEKYLASYPKSPEAEDVRLALGIIYARDLQQYEAAEDHLSRLLEQITDERRRDKALQWLAYARQALGHPTP